MKPKLKFILLLTVISITTIITYNIVKEYRYKKEEEKRIEYATIAIKQATINRQEWDIEEAKKAVNLIKTNETKEYLKLEIENIEIGIKKEKIKIEYENSLYIVEKNLNQTQLNELIKKINKIEYADIKKKLLEKADIIQKDITKEKERISKLDFERKMKEIDETSVISTPPTQINIIEKINGKITAFTPYCTGCHGYTASGKYIGNGDIYQYDKDFGMVRIVAGDYSYPFGTIVKIKNLNYFGEDIYAMVLDRGGAVGKNKRALFDLLFATKENAYKFGIANNVECEILRIGY